MPFLNCSRRTFISTATLLSAPLLLPGCNWPGTRNFTCSGKRLPGAQLFSFREGLERDAAQVFDNLYTAGIREVELYGVTLQTLIFGMQPELFRALVGQHGLKMTVTHISGDTFDVPAISRNAKALGLDTVILAVAPGVMQFDADGISMQGPQTQADLDALVNLLNTLGRDFAEEGLRFGYHNHHIELLPAGDHIILDYLIQNTDPQLVSFELDLGWIALVGADPVYYLNEYADRIISCHLKDFRDGPVDPSAPFQILATHLVEPGAGTIDYAAVLKAMDAAGVEHSFIEIDVSNDPLAAVTAGSTYLNRLAGC